MKGFLRAIRQFLSELRRRNVYRVALTYLAAGFVVVELADIAAGTFDLPGWFGPMVWVLVGLGFPIALVLAWALEVTPEGVRVEEPEGSGETPSPGGVSLTSTGLIVGLLALAIGLQLYPSVSSSGEGTEEQPSSNLADTAQVEERSIAILPFENQGGEKSKQFTEGVHDGLLTKLSRVSDLQVISRTSVAQYAETDKTIPQIAEELGVRWIVEGAVQRVGGQVQVNAQLIRAASDAHRWAKSYRRPITPESFFTIQSELTKKIARSLRARLTPEEADRVERAPTQNLGAYQLYVQGRQELARRSDPGDEHVQNAIRLFRRAINQDSSFALAWSGLADAAYNYPSDVPDSVVTPRVSQEFAARRALKLDPDLAEAHASMGFVHYKNHDAPAALQAFKRALKLKPSYWEAQHGLARVYVILDRREAALRHFKLAVELNPRHARARHGLYDAYNATGQPKKSLREARRQRRMGLEHLDAIGGEVRALNQMGRLKDARRLAEKQVAKLGVETGWGRWFRVYLVGILAQQGDSTQARKYLSQLRTEDVHPLYFASAYRRLGKVDRALDAFGQMDEEDWGFFVAMGELRLLGQEHPSVQDDPRYQELLREANRAWGLNPDGSLPEEIDVPTSQSER